VSPFASTLGPSAYWYLTRATGFVSLVVLTAVVVLGVLGSLGVSGGSRWPRFAIGTLHRDLSLLVIVLIAIHVVTTVLDGFAPINLVAAVIPFVSPYRPVWLGLGALAFDSMVALVITSLLRRRLGYRAWRAVHWLAYASWPVAVLHGLGTGSDSKQAWALALTLACVIAVSAAVIARVTRDDRVVDGLRSFGVLASVATPLAIAAFTVIGPLAPHWAERAGTPARLLGEVTTPGAPLTVPPQTLLAPALKLPFRAHLDGTIRQSHAPGGALLDLALTLSGGASGELRIRMAGAVDGGGGLSMTGSQVDMVAQGLTTVMAGQVVQLQGTSLAIHLTAPGHASIDLAVSLSIDNQTESVTGTVTGQRA
jgi:sulfoxide reductase heme-binding subunit YedZ